MKLKLLPKSEHQITVELRNEVAARIISQKASERYWRVVADKSKPDTQEKVDAISKAAVNQQLVSKDKLYLRIIDEMLEGFDG